MRRDEFKVTDMDEIKAVMRECEYGVLSLIADGEPYGVAVNFVFFEDKICFHGAKEGRKAKAIKANPHASFLAVKPYSLIPSYFSDTNLACSVTQFFASIHLYGNVMIVENNHEKAKILDVMMQKLQSEGGYDEIHSDNPMYTKMLEKTDVYTLIPKTISMKIKVGQNFSDEKKQSLVDKLQERNNAGDNKSAFIIKSYIKS
ncbi:MAG: antibiotic resistance protein [Epsilonproteobacteria bacterium]|nr:antibiotic resistance protein [Campylobacterota bacterium]